MTFFGLARPERFALDFQYIDIKGYYYINEYYLRIYYVI